MAKKLSQIEIDQFREHSWCAPVPALSQDELEWYQRKFAEWEARHGGPIDGNFRNKPHLFLAWLDELVHHPAVLDAVEDLIGPNIWLWHAQFFVKEPRTPSFVSLHQDSAYWQIEPALGVSAWVAFTASDRGNGCMQVIPDTHLGVLEHEDRKSTDNMLWRGQTARLDGIRGEPIHLELRAGEMSLHHARIVHGSGANPSDRRRIGYSIRYVPTHVKRLGPRDSALLVRGVDEYRHFDPEPRPESDFHPEAMAFHAETTKRYMEQYLAARHERELARA